MASDEVIRAVISPKIEVALGEVAGALKKAKVSHALVGGLALDHYVEEPRVTRDIDYVVDMDEWKKAVAAVKAAGFTKELYLDEIMAKLQNKDKVVIDLLFGMGDPEESAREQPTKRRSPERARRALTTREREGRRRPSRLSWMAKPAVILGVRTPIAPPEFLTWMYLMSSDDRHHKDAARLVTQGIDVRRLLRYLNETKSHTEAVMLTRIVAQERGARERGYVRGQIVAAQKRARSKKR